MRRHGWQLPYHPLQVVAIAVFLALGFAFYVFFVPFVGGKTLRYAVMGLYTPLVICVFSLYIWCAATDPADPGLFKSKKYLNICSHKYEPNFKDTKNTFEPSSLKNRVNTSSKVDDEAPNNDMIMEDAEYYSYGRVMQKSIICDALSMCFCWFLWCPLALVRSFLGSYGHSSESQTTEDTMFYCSLCKVEVFKYSKHCRVCDKCVDGFDHHCRWLNNCVGRKNYDRFFTLMMLSLLLLIVQWLAGIFVLICCFIERKRFTVEIIAKLGSSFSFAPFVVVVASCTLLAILATLPLAQLLFFHVLLIKKGISTYDYVVALREKDQLESGGHQSPQMSPLSSLTGFSSVSSFNAFQPAAWCTPPQLFVEDQIDVMPNDVVTSSSSKRIRYDGPPRRKHNGPVKISPWTLAHLNAAEVSRVAAEAKNKSKILHPVKRQGCREGLAPDSSIGSGSNHLAGKSDDSWHKKKRVKEILSSKASNNGLLYARSDRESLAETSSNLAPLQLEARSAFHTSLAMSSAGIMASSPESSLESPDLQPFRVSSAGAADIDGIAVFAKANVQTGVQLLRSTSDGYEPSGEDSERIMPRGSYSSSNWSSLLHGSGRVNSGTTEFGLNDNGGFLKS